MRNVIKLCAWVPALPGTCHVTVLSDMPTAAVPMFRRQVKFDGCGPANNLTRWAELINASGQPFTIENCHWGMAVPTGVPPTALELRSATCNPTSSSQRGFSYNRETKAVTKIVGDQPICAQARPADASGQTGALMLMPCTGGPGQMWEYTVDAAGFGPLVSSADPADCVDMSCGPCRAGKPVQPHACNRRPNQLFRFAQGSMLANSTNPAYPGAGYCVAAVASVAAGGATTTTTTTTTTTARRADLGVGPADDGHCAGLDTPGECPYSFYRSSGDVINSFERVHANVHTLLPFLGTPPLSKPGSWAYADGMELGRMSSEFGDAEDRTIFGWYVITSSPLYLGHNISDDTVNDKVWPIISNREAIRINQHWSGHPGILCLGLILTTSGACFRFMLPYSRRAMNYVSYTWPSNADWPLQSDVVPDSRL